MKAGYEENIETANNVSHLDDGQLWFNSKNKQSNAKLTPSNNINNSS